MNLPSESKHFMKMFSIDISDVYAVQIQDEWYRFQVIKIEDDSVTGIFIDLGMEWSVTKSNVMFLPPKFLKVPSQVSLPNDIVSNQLFQTNIVLICSQAIKCSLTSLYFAPYFQVANVLFHKMLFGKEFTLVPDNIECNVPLVTLYDGKCNMNDVIRKAIIEKTNFNKVLQCFTLYNLNQLSNNWLICV